MCYSAMVWADYRSYVRDYGAVISIKEFYDLFWRRKTDPKVKIPRGMEAAFAEPANADERAIKGLIDEFNAEQAHRFEEELFKQRKRLADAERTLQVKTTKAALESLRIAGEKIGWLMGKLVDLKRTEPLDRDFRIFPGHFVPVMVMEEGRRVVKPMRYQCRPAGKPAFYDVKYPGTYNARRDNLSGFWKAQYGHTHGLMVVTAFYENVSRHKVEGRDLAAEEEPENVILEFRPRPAQDMAIACLWSRWTGEDEPDLLSFAAITDEPPPEIAAAGHDRCIIPIQHRNIDAWLRPGSASRADLESILDDRARPFYEHRLAA